MDEENNNSSSVSELIDFFSKKVENQLDHLWLNGEGTLDKIIIDWSLYPVANLSLEEANRTRKIYMWAIMCQSIIYIEETARSADARGSVYRNTQDLTELME